MTYLLVLTFLAGAGKPIDKNLSCKTWACVETIMAYTHESRRLCRLRVFRSDNPAGFLNTSGLTAFPPMIDQWMQ